MPLLFMIAASFVEAKGIDLLLFDAGTQTSFAGCLTCAPQEPDSICNESGSYGSRHLSKSLWNIHGPFGSKYSPDSPWNKDGAGLVVVDASGTVYGNFSRNPLSHAEQPPISSVRYMIELYERYTDLSIVRDLICER
uniref:Uncharacterized protein n=1 Tax=Alloyangia mangrovi TaxID=1779329 RepID=A0A2A3JQ71_9RHOB